MKISVKDDVVFFVLSDDSIYVESRRIKEVSNTTDNGLIYIKSKVVSDEIGEVKNLRAYEELRLAAGERKARNLSLHPDYSKFVFEGLETWVKTDTITGSIDVRSTVIPQNDANLGLNCRVDINISYMNVDRRNKSPDVDPFGAWESQQKPKLLQSRPTLKTKLNPLTSHIRRSQRGG